MFSHEAVYKKLTYARTFKELRNVSVTQNYYRSAISCAIDEHDYALLVECWNEYMSFVSHASAERSSSRLRPRIGKPLLKKLQHVSDDPTWFTESKDHLDKLQKIAAKAEKLQEDDEVKAGLPFVDV